MELEAFNRQWDQIRSGVDRFRPWFVLCRLPHSLAVSADPLAGALVAGAGWGQVPFAIVLMLAVLFLHAGAMALNDSHDFKTDRIENPDRPVAAGRIGRWHALFGSVVLLCVGMTLAQVPGPQSTQMAFVLLGIILLYEFIMKGAPAGKALPAFGRALALLMGMMLVPAEVKPGDWSLRVFGMCVLGVYVLGAIVLGRRPADQNRRAFAVSGAVLIGLAVLALAFMRLFLPGEATQAAAAVWIGLLAIGVGIPVGRAIVRPGDETLRVAAWAAVLGAVLVDAALVAFVRGLPISVPFGALVIAAFYARRQLDSAADSSKQEKQ